MGPPSRAARNYGFLIYRLLHTSLARHLYKAVVYHLVGYRARCSFSLALIIPLPPSLALALSLFASSKRRARSSASVVLAHPVLLSRDDLARSSLFLRLSFLPPRPLGSAVNDERAATTVTLTIAESSRVISRRYDLRSSSTPAPRRETVPSVRPATRLQRRISL